ncbi:MAG: hypothetical protein IJZ68_14535 [Bacteroidaceae bacterium]|nr:hypothetical protein [Bacteroidaceae bacterium]MBQ8807626.1 hypothetical protein [Bacteroidaceae bacterium]
MARLTIIQKNRRFMPLLPHKILIGGQAVGLMRTPCVHIEIPQGAYEITIQSLFPFIKSSAVVRIDEGVDNVMEFEDKEKYWDILFSVDMLLWIASLFIELQKPYSTIYHIVSEGFFAIWLIHIIVIRKRYFKITTH